MKYLLTLFFSMSLFGCFPVKNVVGDCKADPKTVFDAITPLLYEEKFEIKVADVKNGFLLAEIPPMPNNMTLNGTVKWVWRVTVRDGRVVGEALMSQQVNNVFGAPQGVVDNYADDDAAQDLKWYWLIRNKLQETCGNTLIVVKK